MKRVAVLGGGPAGALAAERLARAGLATVLIDEKMAWEKPCGGGITYKAYTQYPFLLENSVSKKNVSHTRLSAPNVGSADLSLTRPILIYSRLELNRMLLQRAEAAGARLEKTRVIAIERTAEGWRIRTRDGELSADYCIVATGARNALRDVGTTWSAGNTMTALGYFVPGERDRIDLQFLPDFAGYIWVFPRNGHLSVGICGKERSAQQMRALLERYMKDNGIRIDGASYYGHVLPSLAQQQWRDNRIAGDGWMAVGDAAGMVDPITGEGIYYAIRSADLATQMLTADRHAPAEIPAAYRMLLKEDFVEDMELAARISPRLYLGQFLRASVPSRMIQFVRSSPAFCDVMQDLFAGTQNYLDLKPRLKRLAPRAGREVVLSTLLRGFGKTA